jgi:demethylmenaquinone methyltransferase / 2-methoxy-6-polyprenyl-1,4-benzoquinol methylase
MTESRPRGSRPPGAAGDEEAAHWVRGMFGAVAQRYDLLNHLLSLNIDRSWRRRTVHRLRPILARPGVRVLDLCCGTGDLLFALEPECHTAILGCDFSHPMLELARQKAARRGVLAHFMEADALRLPLADASLDLVATAFGFRNLANYRHGLAEMARVLRPGGVAAILEFSRPPHPLISAFYNFYSRRLLPAIGGAVSGSREAYAYLPESVRRFPSAEDLADDMARAGFQQVGFTRMTAGIVALHLGTR